MTTEATAKPNASSRAKAVFTGSRDLVRIALRDPERLPERLTLKAVERLAEPSLTWATESLAQRPQRQPAALAKELCRQTAGVARIDGAIAGTPFYVALVPGYVGYLWQEATMVLRVAALYGWDPRDLRSAAGMLVLRGVQPTLEAAQLALEVCDATPLPQKPDRRRPLRQWVQSIRRMLVFGGFLSPRPDSDRPSKLAVAGGLLLGAAGWAVTWVFPVTLMLLVAWGCETNARDLGRRAVSFYGGDPVAGEDRARNRRRVLPTIALLLSVALPITFVAYAAHVRNSTGLNALGAIGALVALSLVIATTVFARRG